MNIDFSSMLLSLSIGIIIVGALLFFSCAGLTYFEYKVMLNADNQDKKDKSYERYKTLWVMSSIGCFASISGIILYFTNH